MPRWSLPLRAKLTLWALGIFLLVHLAVSSVWILARHAADAARFDRELAARAELIVRELAVDPLAPPQELARRAHALAHERFLERSLLRVLLPGAGAAAADGEPLLDQVQPPPRPDPEAAAFGDSAVELPGGERDTLRLVTLPLAPGQAQSPLLLLAARAPAPRGVLAALREPAALSLPIGLLAAAAAAWVLARRVVSPLERLASAARSVSPARAFERIDVAPLDREVARLQAELNQALERLEGGFEAQGNFIANVSHELKTPVAVLLSQAQVLRRGEPTRDEYEHFAATVEEEMRAVGRMIESFLLLARVGQGRRLARHEPIGVNDLVVEAAERCAALSRQHGTPLSTHLHLPLGGEGESELIGDPELLRTMIENLLRNALRFSPHGVPVELRVACTAIEATVRVRDHGPGIPKEYIGSLFERYFQVPTEGHAARGTGLGLAIAKSIAELHEGTIAVHNCRDGGCEFEIRLPLARDGG